MVLIIEKRGINMIGKCNYCINESACSECNKKRWLDKFIPSDNVKKYFKYSYNGVMGLGGKYTWDFDTTNPDLIETHSVTIDGKYYCPYCCEPMFSIQADIKKYNDYSITGHCCICDGARSEIEYEIEKDKLEKKHITECSELQEKYRESLKFDSEKLFEIKQANERKDFEFSSHGYTHFSTLNGSRYSDINEIVR